MGQFKKAVNDTHNKTLGITDEMDLQEVLKQKPTINIGIFGSIQHTLAMRQPVICGELMKQVRTSFRTINLAKPDM